MATKTAAAANAASDQSVALRKPLKLLNDELAKLSAPSMLAVIEEGKALAASLNRADVLDAEDYAQVLESCRRAATIEKQLDEAFEPFVAAGNALHKGFIKWRDQGASVDALCKGRAAAQRKCGQWQQGEQLRQQQRLAAEQAERERQAEVQRMLDLEELEASGAVEAAEELAAAPIAPVAPATAPPPVVEKVQGTAYVANWKYAIMGGSAGDRLRKIARLIREAMPPGMDGVSVELETIAEFAMWNESAIGATVRALKQDAAPRMASVGIDVFDEGNMRVGAA